MKKNSNSIIYKEINPSDIKVMDGFNQRIDFGDIDELAAQIKEQGLLEAISVVPYLNENGEQKYLLVNGERRYRAIQKLIADGEDVGLIKANLLPQDISDDELFVQQLMRNEGKKFNDIELGMVCKRLLEITDEDGHQKYSRADVAKMLGKNPGVITYALQSLDYDPRIVEMMKNGEIGGTEVRRIYTAARKKYGEDWERMGNEQILKLREKANENNESDKPAKVSIKEDDLYGDVKDTKTFVAGMKTLLNYIAHYEKKSGTEIELDIMDMYTELKGNDKLTLRELFEKAVKASMSNAM
jgi:ParB/RepB/Spo0J family partition protein